MKARSGRGAGKKPSLFCGIAAAFVLFAGATTSEARTAGSADEVCPPALDPCVVSDIVDVDDAATLDFGLRSLRIAAGGRLRITRATILCGSFVTDGPETRTAVEIVAESETGRSLTIAARKGCSLSPQTPCLDDTVCVRDGLGSCNVGEGHVQVDAKFDADGTERSHVAIHAAGDIVTNAELRLNGTGPEGDAGELALFSLQGDVVLNAPVRVRPAGPRDDPDSYYGGRVPPGYAGEVSVEAGRDALFHGPVDLSDGIRGGIISFHAARDVVLAHDVRRDGLQGWRSSMGGDGRVTAGRNIRIEPRGDAGQVDTWFTANAGNALVRYGYGYSYWEAGQGGYTKLDAGGDVVIGESTHLQANSPLDTCGDGVPYAGEFHIYSEGRFLLDGSIDAHAQGRCGSAGVLSVSALTDAHLAASSRIDLGGTDAGRVYLSAWGNLVLDGTIDLRADTARYNGSPYGEGGNLGLQGPDVEIDGTVLAGGIEGGSYIDVDACRIRLKSQARIVNVGGQYSFETVSNAFRFGESFVAERGSFVQADPFGGNYIDRLNGSIEPVLGGRMIPAPVVKSVPYDAWCPTCGNSRIEEHETCDDGNITPGDGCSGDCVNETCIAATDGYPAVPLCDDASSCTDDRCEPRSGVCLHTPSCRDDVECTVETCADDTCRVTSDDSLCDDEDPCTSDLCQAGSGCLHAPRTGEACEDGDLCTLTGACGAEGGCVAVDGALALGGRLTVALRPNDADDSLSARVEVEAIEMGAGPTTTGLRLHLFESRGQALFDVVVPASAFVEDEDDPLRTHASLTDPASGAGVSIDVRVRPARKALVKVSINGADLSAAADASTLGLSLLFGDDPATDTCVAFRSTTCRGARRLSCR